MPHLNLVEQFRTLIFIFLYTSILKKKINYNINKIILNRYVPPEILKRQKDFDYKNDRIDIFSFGVIMSDVLFDEYPMVIIFFYIKNHKI